MLDDYHENLQDWGLYLNEQI